MKGTFKIRNQKGECLCALYTEDYVFFNVLKDKNTMDLFKEFSDDGAYVTVCDLESVPFPVVCGVVFHDVTVPEYYLISLKSAFDCKDFRDFLFKCEEFVLKDDSKE